MGNLDVHDHAAPRGATEVERISVISVGGTTSDEQGLDFPAGSVFVENYSNQYVFVAIARAFVPPYSARLLALGGVRKTSLSFAAPPGITQPSSISGQVCNATWSSTPLPSPGGPVGLSGPTPNYYDRNISSADIATDPGPLGPHGTTTRVTYTVSALRKAFVESVSVFVRRTGVAGAAGEVNMWVRLTRVGGSAIRSFAWAHLQGTTNLVGDFDRSALSNIGLLAPGDIIDIQTNDNSTTGLVEYIGRVKLTEFDLS